MRKLAMCESRVAAVVPGLYRGEREAQEIIERNIREKFSSSRYMSSSLTTLTLTGRIWTPSNL